MSVRHVYARRGEHVAVHRQGSPRPVRRPRYESSCSDDAEQSYMLGGLFLGIVCWLSSDCGFFDSLIFLFFGLPFFTLIGGLAYYAVELICYLFGPESVVAEFLVGVLKLLGILIIWGCKGIIWMLRGLWWLSSAAWRTFKNRNTHGTGAATASHSEETDASWDGSDSVIDAEFHSAVADSCDDSDFDYIFQHKD